MRKYLVVILFVIMFCSLSACQLLFSPKDSMLEYYSVDDNYGELTGTIVEKTEFTDSCLLKINVTVGRDFYLKDGIEYDLPINDYFSIYEHAEIYDLIFVGDSIDFVSAPRIFYDGQNMPIVALKKDEEVLLSFERGKADYIEWIKDMK